MRKAAERSPSLPIDRRAYGQVIVILKRAIVAQSLVCEDHLHHHETGRNLTTTRTHDSSEMLGSNSPESRKLASDFTTRMHESCIPFQKTNQSFRGAGQCVSQSLASSVFELISCLQPPYQYTYACSIPRVESLAGIPGPR